MRGKFITVEGIDGAGKTTHLAWLAEFWRARGMKVRVTREPGGTELGERVRRMLLSPDGPRPHPETEALLMFAARREHIDKVILPTLASGEWVLCDRFSDATFAYQGGGSAVEWEKLEVLERWVQNDLQPDLTLIFDVAPRLGRQRAGSIKAPDRFEREREDFFERVREGYLRRAREAPSRVRVIDASLGIREIQLRLHDVAEELCR